MILSGIQPTVGTFSVLIKGARLAGEPARAIRYFEKFCQLNIPVRDCEQTYCSLSHVLYGCGCASAYEASTCASH